MDLGQFAVATTAIIGLVNGIQLLKTDRLGFLYFLCAVVAGSVFGYLHWFGLPSIELGFAVGLSSSGVYKVAQKLGSQ